MTKKSLLPASVVLTALLLVSCGGPSEQENASDDQAHNEAWISLFDGESLAGWHGYNKSEEVRNWVVEDGILTCLGMTGGEDFGGDLVSDDVYSNFELEWEWKIAEGGNSGVMYHVVEDPKYKAPYETGPEYQMIDDIDFPGTLADWQRTGANYAMNAADEDHKILHPAGEWNTSKIIYLDGSVEHWLNDVLVVAFEEGTEAWEHERVSGKWKDFPDYKIANEGKIALQDHGDRAWFKNIRIRKL